jgi:hypothetical protein
VVHWQVFQPSNMIQDDGEHVNIVICELLAQEGYDWFRERQLLQLNFDEYFPNTGGTKEKFARTSRENLASANRQLGIFGNRLKESVRVEQDFHFRKLSSMFFGRGALKSLGTIKIPLAIPSLRACALVWTGTNLAMGFPAFAITTSSPSATFSNSLDRWILA